MNCKHSGSMQIQTGDVDGTTVTTRLRVSNPVMAGPRSWRAVCPRCRSINVLAVGDEALLLVPNRGDVVKCDGCGCLHAVEGILGTRIVKTVEIDVDHDCTC